METALQVVYGIGIIAVLVAIALSLRRRRHGEAVAPAADWQATAEVFDDPTTGRRMRVYLDPADGSRHYVPEPGPGGLPPTR